MYSESPVSSPDVDCYEECVVTDEFFLPQSPLNSIPPCPQPDSPFSERAASSLTVTDRAGIPKSTSGRITKKGRSRPRSLKDRKCSSPLIMKWLGENYEDTPGGCLPRSVLYTHYQDFCKRNQLDPSSAASFGKIIRLKFPNLRTRRLGTRGQSKYHYYGLAIKETSVYYRSTYSKKGLTRFSSACIKRETGQSYNPSAKTGILLPDFPKFSELNFTKPFPIEKVETFLLMYRAHCQRILDSVVRANFHEIQDFLVHFWQGMPSHMLPILSCQAIVDLVVVCDFILYSTICEVLVPATLQAVSDSLKEGTLTFSHNLVEWLFTALQDLPAALGIRKVQTAEMFGKCLRKESSLQQLAKDARTVLRNSETMTTILNDWRVLQFESIAGQARCNGQHLNEQSISLFREFAGELEQMFVKQSSLEVYFEWLDSVIDRRVNEPVEQGISRLVDLSQEFQIVWSCFNSSIEQELMMTKGKSLESYRLISLVLGEYVSYVLELLQYRIIERQYNDVLKVHGCTQRPFEPGHFGQGSGAPGHHFSGVPPPLLPPSPLHTPISAKANDYFQMFGHHGHRSIAGYHTDNQYFPSAHPSLPSPGFNPMTETFCDTFFKNELAGFSHPSCSVPSTLPLESSPYQSSFIDTPLTPQSSHHSLCSPLSHTTLGSSPEPNIELDYTRPHSQISVHSVGSPNQADMPPMPNDSIYGHSTASSACTSPLTHDPNSTLNIAASLELVAQGSIGASTGPICCDYIPHDGHSVNPNYPPNPYSAHLPAGATGYSNGPSTYSQYDYDLLQLMSSNPDDLLTDPFGVKETKPSLSQLPSPCTPAATPIH